MVQIKTDLVRNSVKSVTTYLTTGQLKKNLIFTTSRAEMPKYW